MKLCRIGEIGKEKPAIIDKDNKEGHAGLSIIQKQITKCISPFLEIIYYLS